jgi:DNA-binding CsgD family transcriptional regulator
LSLHRAGAARSSPPCSGSRSGCTSRIRGLSHWNATRGAGLAQGARSARWPGAGVAAGRSPDRHGRWRPGAAHGFVLRSFRREGSTREGRERLSPREIEVLEALAQGMSYEEIAAHQGISPRTVNTLLHRIYAKLHVHSAAAAVGKWLSRRDSTLCEPCGGCESA